MSDVDKVILYTLVIALVMVFNNMAWMAYVVRLWRVIDGEEEDDE